MNSQAIFIEHEMTVAEKTTDKLNIYEMTIDELAVYEMTGLNDCRQNECRPERCEI